ncbi:hypothetical protein BDY24DRAFT_342088 [Mrakia frigida]|uniref:tRNA dihydrouridine synthase n=1 Tax=Mrakia frigida TaxID=29902 RepID=UPI003FCC1A97
MKLNLATRQEGENLRAHPHPHQTSPSLSPSVAPLVRCSKLPFRHLVSLYNTHITTTPMMLAAEFSRNGTARETDFSTSKMERGEFWMNEKTQGGEGSGSGSGSRKRRRVKGALIAQFAASEARSFADACEMISPFVDGVDLNCGCPQKWAYQEKIGAYLLRQPETVRDLVRAAKDRLGWNYPVSIKIRVDSDQKMTERLVETAIQVGISHLTIHGRTRQTASTQPVDLPAIAFANSLVNGRVPTVANGDAWTYEDVQNIRAQTGVQGVMAARGLLANPALFSNHSITPPSAITSFLTLSSSYGFIFPLFHRHLSLMLEAHLSRPERVYFNTLGSQGAVEDWLEERGVVRTYEEGGGVGGTRWVGGEEGLADGRGEEGFGVVKGWDGRVGL